MIKTINIGTILIIGIFPLISYSQNDSNTYKSEYHKEQIAQLRVQKNNYEKMQKDLTDGQKEICQMYLNSIEKQLSDANEYEMIKIYKQFQQIIMRDPNETKTTNKRWYALWDIFGLDQPVIYACNRIAGICRDSKTMAFEEKITEIEKQGDISNDYRIRKMAIDLLTENNKYIEAIDYCQKVILGMKSGEKNDILPQYQYYLIETRILYQRYLFREAVKVQGLNMEDVINIGPQLVKIDMAQYRIAKSEAERLINEEPKYASRCNTLFSSDLIGELEEVKEFTDHLKEIISLQKKEDMVSIPSNKLNQ